MPVIFSAFRARLLGHFRTRLLGRVCWGVTDLSESIRGLLVEASLLFASGYFRPRPDIHSWVRLMIVLK